MKLFTSLFGFNSKQQGDDDVEQSSQQKQQQQQQQQNKQQQQQQKEKQLLLLKLKQQKLLANEEELSLKNKIRVLKKDLKKLRKNGFTEEKMRRKEIKSLTKKLHKKLYKLNKRGLDANNYFSLYDYAVSLKTGTFFF